MNFYYETNHLVLKIEHQSAASKVLDFYKKNRIYFDGWEITRPDNFYSLAFQSACLSLEYNQIIKKHSFRFWLYDKASYFDNPMTTPIIGSVSVSNILRGGFQTGMLGYKLDHDYWGKGYAFEACSFIITLLFQEYKLHRLEAYVMPANQRSIHLIEQLGFHYEGIKQSSVQINHKWEDHLQYALINPYTNVY